MTTQRHHGDRLTYLAQLTGGIVPVTFLQTHAPTDEDGYLEFARSMERPDFYEAIKDAKPLTPISTFTYPANLWRRYDRLSRFPTGLFVIGDANSSFNPVYGQGMSAGALQVEQLRLLLERCKGDARVPDDLHKKFFRKTAKIIRVPWMLATQSDFLYPNTRGKRLLRTKPLNWYLKRVLKLCSGSDRITTVFYDVLHFTKKPTSLFYPSVCVQVLLQTIGLKESQGASKRRPTLLR